MSKGATYLGELGFTWFRSVLCMGHFALGV